tara:strand:- start:52 stop:1131 length:1080 start_codon:yes stop_codon:yes gene_type:complete
MASGGEGRTNVIELSADVLALIIAKLPFSRKMIDKAPTCRAFAHAVRLAVQAHRRVCYEGHRRGILAVAAASDGHLITGAMDKTIKVWRGGKCVFTTKDEAPGHSNDVNALAVLPGGVRFVSCSDDGTAKLWRIDGTLERTFHVNRGVLNVAVLPDGAHFVVGTRALVVGNPHQDPATALRLAELKLYHVSGRCAHTYTAAHKGDVRAVAVTADGLHIISGAYDHRVSVWSVANKSHVSTCDGHDDTVWAVAAMPDSQRLLSASSDKSVRLWLLNGTLENTFKLHRGTVHSLLALPDNRRALSGGMDSSVALFDVNDGALLRRFVPDHYGRVMSLAPLPDGRRFAIASSDSTVRICELY